MAHEFDGKKYEKASAHQKEWGAKLIAELTLKGDERVLDLGCGDGVVTAEIAGRLPQGEEVGIDASEGMIQTATARERSNLRFIRMDINEIEFEDAFDVICSNATLHWVKDHERLLRNASRALRKGGVLRFNFAGQGNCAHLFKVVRNAMELEGFAPYFDNFDWPWYMPDVLAYRHVVDSSGLAEAKCSYS